MASCYRLHVHMDPNLPSPDYVTLQDAERLFGVAASTLRRWIKEGQLTSYMPARRVLIDVHELRARIRESQRPVPPST